MGVHTEATVGYRGDNRYRFSTQMPLYPRQPSLGLKLQAEGHDVRCRNAWIQELDLKEPNTDF